MPAIHVDGPSGSGKSTVGRVLKQRGFRVIETDFEEGLSAWYDNQTREKVVAMPEQPYPKEWLASHSWLWNLDRANELFDSVGKELVFFCGGAHNWKEFEDRFDTRIGLWVSDNATLTVRLQEREPERWSDGSAELTYMLEWNQKYPDFCRAAGIFVIDTFNKSTEEVTDSILSVANDKIQT